MSAIEIQHAEPEQPKRPIRNLPHLIKYILLLFLLLLLAAEFVGGEFGRFGPLAGFILILKLILIFLLILLIWLQKGLVCEITKPTGCTEEEVDPTTGLFVKVIGTATGAAFGHYVLEVKKGAITYPASIVTYPPGGGGVPVVNGELGRINTTSLSDATYTITLTVYPTGLGAPKSCSITFDLLKVAVYMSRVGTVQAVSMLPAPNNPNPFDPLAELRLAPAFSLVAVGGVISIEGAAYIYECANRRIKKYGIRYVHVTTPGTEPTQPNKDDPIPVAFATLIPPLPLEYVTADYYQPWTRVGIAPRHLINSWSSFTLFGTTYYKLNPTKWNSAAAGSGRFSLLLTAEDTAGHLYHDIQHIWLDNKAILGKIVKFQRLVRGVWNDIPPCTDLLLSFGTIRILGLAWDPVIDEAWWPPAAPNDNFGYYRLDFWKQFGGAFPLTANIATRVPTLPALPPVPVPTNADAGELAQWDLTTLDAGPSPSPYVPPPDPKVYRGESCTYNLQLFVTDTAVVNDAGTTHYVYHLVPVKIINDL